MQTYSRGADPRGAAHSNAAGLYHEPAAKNAARQQSIFFCRWRTSDHEVVSLLFFGFSCLTFSSVAQSFLYSVQDRHVEKAIRILKRDISRLHLDTSSCPNCRTMCTLVRSLIELQKEQLCTAGGSTVAVSTLPVLFSLSVRVRG